MQPQNVMASSSASSAAPASLACGTMPELAHHVRAPKRKATEGPHGRAKTARISKQTAIALQKRAFGSHCVDGFANSGLKVLGGNFLVRAMPANPAEHQFKHDRSSAT